MASKQSSGIEAPHDHDVLSGRGNFVNYHSGNEHFRALVRKHKLEYVKCPKPEKGKFSRIIVDEIKSRNPPGRFLKQDPQTKLWYDIGEKKALDKTRQALREGAPDIMKEMSGESGSESDDPSPRMVQKTADGRRNSAPANFTPDGMHCFMGSPGFQSPSLSRNGMLSSTGLNSPGTMLSPGLLLSSLSPEYGQFSVPGRTSIGGRMVDPSALPGPPLQTQFDSLNQMNPQQQQQAQAMMMSSQINSSNFGNMGMMSPEQIQLQNQINAQHAQMQMLQRQLEQQQQQMSQQMNANNFNDMQMMKKLQAMQSMARMNSTNNQNLPTPTQSNMMFQNNAPCHFDSRLVQNMPPPPPVQRNSEPNVTKESLQPGIEIFPGNARRLPPPSLMKREDSNNSIKMDKVFSSPQSLKKKYDANNSSTHLSAMSLSIGDMQEEGNLSSVFDSSLRISTNPSGGGSTATKEKLRDKSNKDNYLEMSVNTLGTNTTGNDMSYATLGDNDLQSSDGNMSFGKVFEDPKD